MGTKPKTRKIASKAKKPKEAQKEQSERFIEAARNVGVDETGKEFEKAVAALTRGGKRPK